jgi:hypothetical protein
MSITKDDKTIVRDLKQQLDERGRAQARRRARGFAQWDAVRHLSPSRPPVMTILDLSCWDIEVVPDESLRCTDPQARSVEKDLRRRLFMAEAIHDDSLAERNAAEPDPVLRVSRVWRQSDWGLPIQWHDSDDARGAFGFEPVISGPDDLDKLKQPVVTVDDEATHAQCELLAELYGACYEDYVVQPAGGLGDQAALHLMGLVGMWRGLGELMLDMYDNPQMLHDLMGFLAEAHHNIIDQYVELDLLERPVFGTNRIKGKDSPVNESGTTPAEAFVWTEAQELTEVSPEQHWEFSMAYEKELVERFGNSSYGCCEDLTNKVDHLRRIENLHTIGVTPWASVAKCVEQIGTDFEISWRPHPGWLAAETFDEDGLRSYLRENLDTLKDSVFHICWKDVQTLHFQPERLTRMTDILNEEIDRIWGSEDATDAVDTPEAATADRTG